MIYFMTARELNRVKIGHAKSPPHRLKELQCGSPARLVIEATAEGGQAFEAELHTMFSRDRLHGEWFEITPAIEMAIHFLRSDDPIPEDAQSYLAPFLIDHFKASQTSRGAPLFASATDAGDGQQAPASTHSSAA